MNKMILIGMSLVLSIWAGQAFSAESEETPSLGQDSTAEPPPSPFDVDPSKRSVESTERLREQLREQELSTNPDANRRMFRPKQPEPGYSEIRPYPGSEGPDRVKPIRPLP